MTLPRAFQPRHAGTQQKIGAQLAPMARHAGHVGIARRQKPCHIQCDAQQEDGAVFQQTHQSRDAQYDVAAHLIRNGPQ
ncbi:hypothetical protein SDC9_89569 [bioreactor metagenome]|uniref:Uncharacterized protein n=1 Tax=bioreactor metagenome TaxID=1076179 RepID=A0A644ZQ68_9ZZZZ